MAEPERRRRRPAVSCSLCRRRKIRCNQETPCSNCIRSKSASCVYDNQSPRQAPRLAQRPKVHESLIPKDQASTTASNYSRSLDNSTSASTPASLSSVSNVDTIRAKIRELEAQLPRKIREFATPPPTIETSTSSIAGVFHLQRENRLPGQAHVVSSVLHKTRYFGQSHWINGLSLYLDVFHVLEPHVRDGTSEISAGIQRCKSLGRTIKSQRAPPLISPSTLDLGLPSKEVIDELVNCYLGTIETVYRILHVPTFKRDYEALWATNVERNKAFLIQLKLVLAIGAATYDECFSLRTSATRWVYEAQFWLSEPESKGRLSINYLQTNLLLIFAREAVGVEEGMNWVSAGALLRTAVYMGLHRDPSHHPKRATFVTEMRRRIWNSILEVNLQTSLYSGGPPFIDLKDFDTEPPDNFDDEQLLLESAEPRPRHVLTPVSVAIALRQTFAVRLAITRFLNNLDSKCTYADALRLDTEIREAHKMLSRTLQAWSSIPETQLTTPTLSQFATRLVDCVMRRFLSALHIPFFASSLHDPTFAFSRKVVIETSLKIWYSVCPSQIQTQTQTPASAIHSPSSVDTFSRFVICAAGFFRTSAMQASCIIAAELRAQLQEEESLSPSSVLARPDLLTVLEDSKTWALRCIAAGETNMKGYFCLCLMSAQTEGLMRRLSKEGIESLLADAAVASVKRCVPMLEDMAGGGRNEEYGIEGELLQGLEYPHAPGELVEGWNFTASEELLSYCGKDLRRIQDTDMRLDLGNTEPMSWLFDDETMQNMLL
ncbi:hypothetical protein BCR34DRAFT_471780 [Clohesyomyces aquaticus]|uniref:Zn(2)-C6 fungal-type domain-containing protein n=1 Tax=Clohesyomyces aquaticus TaxID=1231657 RepID=A0A1Y2AB84_9PLEO|nr:hypothetical protein BCR34DRAFT_471780 [Clohesyomyces aquaticus]